MRRFVIGAGVLALVLVVAVLAIHAPPVRRAVLRYAVATLEEQYRLRIDVDRLDYNLARLSVTLSGVSVAANHTPDMPFFGAARVAARVSRSALGGPLAFDDLLIEGGRLRVVRTTSGTNLPLLDDAGGGPPQPLRLAHVRAAAFAITVQDEVAGASLEVPAIDIDLAADDGRLALQRAATIGYAGRATQVTRLAGDATFDGRTLALSGFQAASPELALTLDGTLDVIAAEPGVQAQVSGSADVSRLAAWGLEGDLPQGTVAFEGRVAGPLAAPRADLMLRADTVRWLGLDATALEADAAIGSEALDVTRAQFTLAGGLVEGTAQVEYAAGGTREAALTWRGLDLERLLVPLAAPGTLLPAGTTSGDLDARSAAELGPEWVAGARVTIDGGRNAPGRFSAPGETQLRLVQGRWQLDGAHTIAGVAPATLRFRGTLPDAGLAESPVDGVINVAPLPPAALLEAIGTLGLADLPPDLIVEGGTVAADVTVRGTVGAPRIAVAATLADTGASAGLGRARIDGVFNAAGPPSALRGTGRFEVTGARWDDVEIGEATVDVALEPGRARLAAAIPAFGVAGTGEIALAAPYRAVLDLQARNLDVSPLTARLEQAAIVTGRTDLVAHAEGPLEAWRTGSAQVEVGRLDLLAGALPITLDGPARVTYAAGRLTIERLEMHAGRSTVGAEGTLALDAATPATGGIGIVASGDAGDLAQAAELTGLVDLPIVGGSGPVRLTAAVRGTIAAPDVSGSLDAGPMTVALAGFPLVTSIRVRADLQDDVIAITDFAAEYQGARATARGIVPVAWFSDTAAPAPGPGVLTARVLNVTEGVLDPFLDPATLADIDGTVDLTVDLSSPGARIDQVSGHATLDRFDLRLAGLPLTQRVPTRVEFGGGFARVSAWDWAGQGVTLNVAGQVRMADLQAGIIATGDLDARMLTPFIREAGLSSSGRLAPRLSITGPLASPRIDGDLAITAVEIRLVDPRVVVSGLNGRAVLTRTTANLANLAGTINGGSLSAAGEVEFVPRQAIRAALTAAVRGMGIEVPDGLRSELDADLTFAATQTLDADINTLSGELAGTVTVLRGAYREPLAVIGGLLSAIQARAAVPDRATASPFLDDLALDLRILTADDVIVDNNTARLAAGADLRVGGTAAAPTVAGRLDLREGGRIFLGRNVYEIASGGIDFADPAAIRPELDLQLTTRAGGQPIDVALSGTADAPVVALSSSNPDLTQADLTSLLVTGRLFDELASADAALIGSTVIGNLSGDVLGFAGRAVGLDTLRLGGVDAGAARRDPTAAASEVDPTSRLTFGKSIGGNLDVTLSQSLRDATAQTWIVDYLPSRRILLRLVSNDEDLRAYSFRHDVSLGAPQLARPPAVARAPDPRVAAVAFTGDLAVSEEQVRGLLELEAGDRFDFATWQDDRERLEGFYRSSNRLSARVTATRAEQNDGVALAYAIEAGPQTRIEVSGATLGDATLEALRDAWSLAIVDDLLVDEARQIVVDALAADGYLRPQVAATLSGDAGVRTLAVVITPGTRTTDVRLAFTGVPDAAAADLAAWAGADGRLQAVREPGAFETAVLAHLQGLGYLEAQVAVGAARLEGETADVPVSVAIGRQFVASAVRFEGNSLPEDQLLESAALEPGAPLGPFAIEDARQRILTLYRREGFPSAEVSARPGAEGITFAIDEGGRQSIADLAVTGRGRVDADVVGRAIRLEVGMPLRADELIAARSRLFDTGLFRRVDVTTEPMASSAAAAGAVPVRVRVTLEEWPSLRLRYGLELAEERPADDPTGRNLVPGISADLTRRTLFGRAVSVGLSGRYQQRERRARLFLTSPTFASLPLESSLTVERSREDFAGATLVSDIAAVAWEQRSRLRRSLQLSYAYRFERNHTFDTQPLPGDPFPFDLTINVARLTGSAAWDTRTSPDDPVAGTFLSSTLEWAPRALGSDFLFVRYVAQAYRFTPWRGVVLASAARFGAVHALGGQDVIPSERFFAGGARSVRGVAEEGLGDRDFFGDPVGGEALLLLNQEVRFPVYRWLRGVGFVDAGNVFREPGQIRVGDLTASVGAGLRLVTPFAILRADIGRVIDTGDHRWSFGIGHAF